MPPSISVDLTNVQGIIHHFYLRPVWRHLLFKFSTPAAGKQCLSKLLEHVTPASLGESPAREQLLNIGLTAFGLKALGVPSDVMAQFPAEFLELPDPIVMGDFGDSAPDHWWNGEFPTSDIHIVVHLFSNSLTAMDAWTEEIRNLVAGNEIEELIPTSDGKAITGMLTADHKLHFGYRDGLSQPVVAWDDNVASSDQINFRHFLLGYSTPEIRSSPPLFKSLPGAEAARLIVVDGTYSVFRLLYQDVACFNRFLADEAPKIAIDGQSPAEAQELLAAKLMGRWRDGTPLVLSPTKPDRDLVTRNDFEYKSADPDGKLCPLSAHVRVVNPRSNEELIDFEQPVPRVIRRGTPFGDRLEGTHDDGRLRGLAGMFFCASIAGQFYKMTSWMKMNNFSKKFDGHTTEQDPMANRSVPQASRDFRIPNESGAVTVKLQDFTRTLGTAFFLIPSLSALRHLANWSQ